MVLHKTKTRIGELRQKLSESGHRITPQRLCILQALIGANSHPSAEDIYAHVRRVSPTTSLGTVYKTLDTLKEMGELREIPLGDGRNHYDAMLPLIHPHVICSHCGKIEDVVLDGLNQLQTQAGIASGYGIESQRVEFYGLCASCQP